MKNNKFPVPPLPEKEMLMPVPLPPQKKVMTFERGREPPQALDLEQVILGAMMIDKNGLNEVVHLLNSEIFFDHYNGLIFQAIFNVHNQNVGVDLLTVSTELKRMNKLAIIGGDYYLISLAQKVSSSAHIEFHARIILQKYVLRELIKLSFETSDQAFNHNPDIFNLMDNIEKDISRIYKFTIQSNGIITIDAKKELYDRVKSVALGEAPGIYTGVSEYDDWCGGFYKRELIVIAARTGMGKTTVALAIASNTAFDKQTRVAFFSLEMSIADLKSRLAAKGTGIPYTKIRQGKLIPAELTAVLNYYDVVDNSTLILIDRIVVHEKIMKKIRDLVIKDSVEIVMIDYVQLIKLTRRTSSKTADIGDITNDLKALANELNIPILIVAQLSRSVDDRPGHRPLLTDLKWAGAIEEDADTVAFILRDAYYNTLPGMELPMEVAGRTEFIIAKGRNTGTRTFWTYLDFNTYDFRSLNI